MTSKTIELGAMARTVAERINEMIINSRHHFHFNNHRTSQTDSLHKEQRKSATYYALYTCGIPAFGIETSKSLPLEKKVRYHNLAINAFMDMLGIEPETPGINLDSPRLDYLVIAINDSLPVVVKDGQMLNVCRGDTIMISHIESNYARGLTADIVGYGNFSDTRKTVTITKPARVVVRKDYYPCGHIRIAVGQTREIAVGPQEGGASSDAAVVTLFDVKINGHKRQIDNFGRVAITRGIF